MSITWQQQTNKQTMTARGSKHGRGTQLSHNSSSGLQQVKVDCPPPLQAGYCSATSISIL